jgi:hypothetical protein
MKLTGSAVVTNKCFPSILPESQFAKIFINDKSRNHTKIKDLRLFIEKIMRRSSILRSSKFLFND